MALGIDDLIELYRTAGAARYGKEAINQEQHALQCASLAERAGAPPVLVAAALLHDLGHLVASREHKGGPGNDRHEFVAIPFLHGVFPDAVIEPIRMHVDAKRYLCATRPDYWEMLSPASQRSLELQGGPFSAEDAAHFIAQPFACDAVALRRWDDGAKSPTTITPGWGHYRRMLASAALIERVPA